MCVWEDRSLVYRLVREGFTDTVTFDKNPERTSHMLCGGMFFQAEGKPNAKS